ncbi:hypothetical protein B0H14DRAFT_3758866 [Mycena olivaceomarginata]|nr:hypothetical protein B0H14DRAFT_3758866 [Mycena olivaceomarginata]
MPKLTPEQKKIQELTAALALKDKIEKLEKQKNASSKRLKLIPKPKGQAGRSAESRGYNVQITLGLNDQDYNRRRRIVKCYIHEYLSVNSPISQQETGAVARMVAKVQQDLPYFAQFEHGWPIRDITRIYLSNEQTRRGRDKEAEARAYPGAQPTTTQPSTTTKTVKKKKAVVFIDTDNDDASDEEDEPLSKKKPLPKKKVVKTVRSETEEDSDKEDDADQNVDADYIDDVDMHESDSDLELLVNRPTMPPIKTPKTFLGDIMDISEPPQNDKKSKKRKAVELPALPGSPAKKTKIKQSVKQDPTLTPPPSAKPSAKVSKTVKIPLAWADLLTTCPSVFCSHPLPATPVPRLLTLFQRAHDLEKIGGPQAKGLALTHLEICSAITFERRRSVVVALGKRRNWPATIDWGDVCTRIFSAPLKKEILDLIMDPQTLKECPIWTDFLLAIDDKLFEFMASKNKDEFQTVIKHKSCGYFGPQGAFVIESCLRRLVAENEEEHDLETSLFNTIYSIIDKSPGRYGDDYYDDSDDSKYLKINDFIAFVLVPFVAVALIVEDYAPRLDFQDALFEQKNSIEFGELKHPEDDADVAAHEVHHQNVLALRSTKLRAAAPPSTHKDIIPPLPLRKDAAAAPPPLPQRKDAASAPPPSPVQGVVPPRHRPHPKPIFKSGSSSSLAPTLKASAHFLRRRYFADRIQIRLPAAKIIPEVELKLEDFVPPDAKKKMKGAGKAVSGAAKAEKEQEGEEDEGRAGYGQGNALGIYGRPSRLFCFLTNIRNGIRWISTTSNLNLTRKFKRPSPYRAKMPPAQDRRGLEGRLNPQTVPLMVVIFSLRFLRDDPKMIPVVDLQPVYLPATGAAAGAYIELKWSRASTVVISPSEKTLPARMTMDLIRCLQFHVAPQINRAPAPANKLTPIMREGQSMTVADYFQRTVYDVLGNTEEGNKW